MSDETSAPRPPHTGLFEHYCQFPGCKKWGAYGYAIGRGESEWICYEHRPEALRDLGSRL